MAELLLGSPLFPGESGVDQLVEIIKVCVWKGEGGRAAGHVEVMRRREGEAGVLQRRWKRECGKRVGRPSSTRLHWAPPADSPCPSPCTPALPGPHRTPALCPCHNMQVLGTPTREEIHAMNPNYTEFKFPQVCACMCVLVGVEPQGEELLGSR